MINALEIVRSALIVVVMLAILIAAHEFGHFVAARLCGIRVREFAIGMGPVIWRSKPKQAINPEEVLPDDAEQKTKGTTFSVRAVPFGGFCDMGEDEESSDPAHFRNKPIWKKVLVLISGAAMNIVVGVVFIVILALTMIGYSKNRSSVIAELNEGFPYSDIQVGDRLVKVNSHAIYDWRDAMIFLGREEGPCSLTFERDGQTFTVRGVERTFIGEDGSARFGITVGTWEEMTSEGIPRFVYTQSINYVRYVWVSLIDLFTGRANIGELAGPVGMVNMVANATSSSNEGVTFRGIMIYLLDLTALVAINLAVVNLLPIPALDGGRILFLFISALLVLVRKRPLSDKIEGYIHGVTYFLLIGLMVLVVFGDIRRWVGF